MIDPIKDSETVTTGEALLAIITLCRKYIKVLENIIRIRESNPEDSADSFRRKTADPKYLTRLRSTLLETKKLMRQMASEALEKAPGGMEHYDEPAMNQRINALMETAMKNLESAYEGKARTFMVILNEFEILSMRLKSKLGLRVGEGIHTSMAEESASAVTSANAARLVYVRLFHRNMSSLLSPKGSLAWMKPLLDCVKSAEKHGLAIYANEEDVKQTIRSGSYGYLTVRIRDEQDISDQRPERQDQQLHCPLLTINGIQNEDFDKFCYAGFDFPIRKGVLYRPKSIMSED